MVRTDVYRVGVVAQLFHRNQSNHAPSLNGLPWRGPNSHHHRFSLPLERQRINQLRHFHRRFRQNRRLFHRCRSKRRIYNHRERETLPSRLRLCPQGRLRSFHHLLKLRYRHRPRCRTRKWKDLDRHPQSVLRSRSMRCRQGQRPNVGCQAGGSGQYRRHHRASQWSPKRCRRKLS